MGALGLTSACENINIAMETTFDLFYLRPIRALQAKYNFENNKITKTFKRLVLMFLITPVKYTLVALFSTSKG